MNEPPEPVKPYLVSYSTRVLEELGRLIKQARGTKRESELRHAVLELDRRLKIYPQFGQPLRDLSIEHAVNWYATVPPLVAEYVIDEDKR